MCQYLDKIEEGMFDDEEDEIIPRGDDEDEDDAAMMEAVLNDEEEDSNEDLEEEEIEEGADEDFEEEEIEEGTDAQPVFAQTVCPSLFGSDFNQLASGGRRGIDANWMSRWIQIELLVAGQAHRHGCGSSLQ